MGLKTSLSIHTPADEVSLPPRIEFLCLGFGEGIDSLVFEQMTNMTACLHNRKLNLTAHGQRLTPQSLPHRPCGPQYDWGFRFPLLPAVFYKGETLVEVRLLLEDGTTLAARPHRIREWVALEDLSVVISLPPPPEPVSVTRSFGTSGTYSPSNATVAAWVSNSSETTSIDPTTLQPMYPNWGANFNVPASWGNTTGSTTTLWAQAIGDGGQTFNASRKVTFSN
jgi:hypothetical protein